MAQNNGNTMVRVLVNNQHFDVSCGKGEQSFQWLATVIQQRIKQFNLMRKSLQEESFIVTELRNQEDELINPKDKLYEHIGSSGLTVRAIVSTSHPVDEWENPKVNDWMQVAYIHSKTGFQWATEIEGWRHVLATTPDHGSATVPHPQSKLPYLPHAQYNTSSLNKTLLPSKSSLIQIGEHFSPQDIENAFNLDWQSMSWRWIASAVSSPFTDVAKSRLGIVLKEQYGLICHLFLHYAGEGRVGQRYGISLQEFGHCLHFAKIVDWKFNEEAIQRIFFSTGAETLSALQGSKSTTHLKNEESKENYSSNNHYNRQDAPRNGFAVKKAAPASLSMSQARASVKYPLMTRAHFAEALVCVALEERFGSQADDAIRSLCEGPLSSFWQELRTHYLCYTSEEAPLLHRTVHDFAQLLRQMFLLYATCDSTFGPRLLLSEFIRLVTEAGIVTDSDQESLCTASLLSAQLNPTVQQEQESIVFAEFLESLSRVAVKAIASYPGLTDGKKIRMAFNMVIEMITNDNNVTTMSSARQGSSQFTRK